ncbi:MAG TPA: efflux RND transporter permease subunit [Candidatus Omnitrophota bacterium]|nr:efflux RND transporter permease subunit [Candidatus Omnitrophota bacterium]
MLSTFVKRPLFTLSIFSVVLLIGLFSLGRLPLDFLPNIEIPSLTIITSYPGASAEDIETTITKVIEDGVATVPNVDKITSTSAENLSTVTLQFKWGTKLDAASADVRDKMDQIRGKLPKDINLPIIYKFDTSQIPVLTFGISSDQSYNQLYELADKKISPALKRVAGVGTVSISGGLVRQINVDIDRHKLEAYHLSIGQVNLALQTANLNMPAGSLKSGALEYGIRVPGEFSKVDEIGRTIIGSFNGKDIFLSDVGTVVDSYKEQDNLTEVDGKPGVTIQVQKQSGANTVQVVSDIRKEINKIVPDLPADIKFTFVSDTSESIVRQIGELGRTLGWSFLFVMLTVLFFLRNVRGSIIVSLAMPFSILAAFIYMFFAGASVNIISLASIIISIGVVVDDAIVVLENIYRHREKKGEGADDASVNGAGEVSGAVLASTTTNLVIFIPMLLVSGFIGIFFSQLASITIVVIAMSFVTAMSLTPMLCSKLLEIKKSEDGKETMFNRFYKSSEDLFAAVENAYRRTLDWALNNRRMVVFSLSALFFLSLALFAFTGTEFFPEQDTGLVSATVTMPSGTRWDQTAVAMKEIEHAVQKNVPETEFVMVQAGGGAQMSFGKTGPNIGKIYLKIVPLDKRKRDLTQIQRAVADIIWAVPGVKSVDFSASGANQLAGGGKPVTVELYGSNFDDIDQAVAKLFPQMEKIQGLVDPSVSREKSNPEYALSVDRDKAAALGLSMYDIAMAARGSIYGTIASEYREGGDQYDIFTRFNEGDRHSVDDIKNVYVTNRLGENVTLGNISDVELRNGPQEIEHKNQQRTVRIEADTFGRPLGDVIGDVQKVINNTLLPNNVTVKIAGSAEQIQESFRSLTFALLLGLALIYLVMVAQFESLIDPFVIMFAVPFALTGVIWALFLTGSSFGVMAFIGLILVAGVAVKNSIVLVDYINILRHRGTELKEAVLEAGRTRLRPILMTSATAILALFPIVISRGEGSGFWKPMAISVIGGLLVSATISLVFVPTVYFIIESRMERKH